MFHIIILLYLIFVCQNTSKYVLDTTDYKINKVTLNY